MKKLTLTPFLALICLGMFVNIAFGQGKSTDTLTKTKLKSTFDKGYELGSGKSKSEMGMEIFHAWKVKYDDNPNYAKIDFDDSNWDTTSTNNNIKDFPDIEKIELGGSGKGL